MRKISVVFIFFGFFVFNTNSATAANCAAGELFNTTTGQVCGNPHDVVGCLSGYLFSPVTGQVCPAISSSASISSSNLQDDFSVDVSKFNDLVNGSDIRALQRFLKEQGYYYGKVDGKRGVLTNRATKDFKTDNNLTVVQSVATSSTVSTASITTTKVPQPDAKSSTSGLSFPVKVLSPKEGETYKAGDVMNISWSVDKNVSLNDTFVVTVAPQWRNVTTKDDQYMLSTPVLNSNVRSYSWTIPDPLPAHDPYPFRVNVGFCQQLSGGKQVLVDGAYSSCSNTYGDSVFNVNIIPSQVVSNPQPITPLYSTIVSSMATTTTIQPSTVTATQTPTTPSTINITPYITILSPNGGETFKVGEDMIINWSSSSARRIYFALTDESGNVVVSNLSHVDTSQNQTIFHIPSNVPAGVFKLKAGIFNSDDTCGDGSCSQHTFLASDLSDGAFVITKQQDVKPPIINNVSGSVTVPIWKMNTWTISASDSQNQQLHYAANWDTAHITTNPNTMTFDQSPAKYHQYGSPGTYIATFFVTNDDFFNKHTGLYAKYSLTINVTPSALDTANIKVISPQAGDVWNYNTLTDPRKLVSIKWTQTDLMSDTVAIDLISSSGEKVENIASHASSGGHSWAWVLDHNLPDGSYAIRIYDDIKSGGASDTGSYFTIINSSFSSTNSGQ